MSLWYRFRKRRRVHLLHIGKTGGTALKAAFKHHKSCRDHLVVVHFHEVKLRDVPDGDMFMFFIRSPLARFVSAFYSRQRQGRPRYFTPWQPGEHKAFETFKTPNELARALESDDAELRDAAEQAMNSIQHIRSSYWDWFENEAYLRSRAKDLFFMGQLDRLEEDFRRLKCKLGIPDHAALPSDDYTAHRTPESADRRLDDQAIATLKQWYKQDFEFIELCQELFDDEGRIGSAPSIESTLGRESEQRKG